MRESHVLLTSDMPWDPTIHDNVEVESNDIFQDMVIYQDDDADKARDDLFMNLLNSRVFDWEESDDEFAAAVEAFS